MGLYNAEQEQKPLAQHCHACGEEQSLDEAAVISAGVAALDYDTSDDELMGLRNKARAYLSDYLTTRHNRLVAMRMPKL